MATLRESTTGMWASLNRGMKVIFIGAVLLIVAGLAWGIYAVAHDDYRTLFAQLSDNDAAAIVDALKKQKIPYRLADGGATIEVPADRVHETRLSLMSSNVALSGGVGFEIFDKQGLGATEQSQRISYQRALQGELSRTISSLENVKQARVHLVLPESSLFKRDKQDATAAVTLTLKEGTTLDRQRILGVQRLVAASVAGLDPSRVIITDQRGITLSTSDPGTGSSSSIEARLELQRQVETQITQKISRMLDSAFGPGHAIISVAVALNFDAVKTTTQAVLPARGMNGADEGDVVRRRQVMSGGSKENPTAIAVSDPTAVHTTSSTLEVEYEHGRRVEEVVGAPGAVKRITVGVIVPPQIGDDEQKRIKEFVQVAAGIDETRGDRVSIQPLAMNDQESASGVTPADSKDESTASPAAVDSPKNVLWGANPPATLVVVALAILLLGAIVGALVPRERRRALSDKERNQLLNEIRSTLGDEARTAPVQAKQ